MKAISMAVLTGGHKFRDGLRPKGSAMILFQITMDTLPEKQKEVVQTILSLMPFMEDESGCLSYSLLREMKDQNRLCVIGEWESREKFNNYLKSESFGVLLGTKSLLRQAHGIRIHTVRKSEGMEAVIAVRER